MAQDYNLEVYDAKRTLLASSALPGNRSEKINLTAAAGRYYVRVVSAKGEWSAKTGYRLNIGNGGKP